MPSFTFFRFAAVRLTLAVVAVWLCGMPLAHAACTNPAAGEGALIYNGDQHVMQYCSGTLWIGMAGSAASTYTETDPKVGTLTSNKWCTSNAGGTAIVCGQDAPSGAASNGATGLVQFSDGSGGFLSDSTAGGELFWDATNHKLGIGTATPNASALLDVTSTTKGFLPPRMTTAQVTAIAAPADGLIAYDTDTDTIKLRANGAWVSLQAGSFSESDPQIGTLTASKWCSANVGGTAIDCTTDAPATGAAGASSEVQFRNNGTGAFAADSNFVWDDTNNRLGIGIAPTLAKLEVATTSGATAAMFGSGDKGISLINNWPSVFFNSYFSTVRKSMSPGFSAGISQDPATGTFSIGISAAAATTANETVTHPSVMTMLASGNVGIGNTAPKQMLDVTGIITTPGMAMNGYFDGTWRPKSAGYLGYIQMDASTGKIYFWNSPTSVAADGASTLNARMVIDKDGNVGIGTASPTATLQVMRGTGTAGTAVFSGTTYSSHFNYSTTEDTYIRGGKAGAQVVVNDQSAGDVVIATGGGNVGIGTAAPAYKLDVTGTTRTTGNYYTNGSLYMGQDGTSTILYGSSAANQYMALYGAASNVTGASITLFGRTYSTTEGRITYTANTNTNDATHSHYFTKYSSGGTTTALMSIRSNGNTYVYGDYTCSIGIATTVSCSSDRRLKKDIETIPNALDSVVKLRGVTFRLKDPAKPQVQSLGFIAQEVMKVYPQAVRMGEDGYYTMEYAALVAPLVEAVKELKGLFDGLAEKVAGIITVNDDQSAQIEALKAANDNQSEQIEALREEIRSLRAGN
ncbi:MAG: tail fiber domain-containing protein [Hyphomicrobium sp.]